LRKVGGFLSPGQKVIQPFSPTTIQAAGCFTTSLRVEESYPAVNKLVGWDIEQLYWFEQILTDLTN